MKKNKIGKIIGFIGLCIFITGISYTLTKYLDKNLYVNTELLITLEDSKEFKLENTNKLSKEDALKTYPNTFKIENKSLKKVDYKVIIESNNKDKFDKINFVLYLNDKEVKEGKLDDLKDYILYQTKINKKNIDTYKLYLYLTEENKNIDFTYSIKIELE